ncbi:EamA domain-containing membrane protein RarD [Cohaesibacter sp. ES.047]|uniref:DMT family transporter n=1 Tax=Cohaesibacter sp. ES.047 TaxID=1798205 RepID=UPI000BC048E2|nr:DMT family transporter [Cohaesibacter sp. ES.047]SNY92062.1 EamA domain-containing membrane protein RarD [Cohaesibacter sp. ES.047]
MTDNSTPKLSPLLMAGRDRPLLGIAFMLSFCAVIPFADALMKILSGSVPVVTVLIVRYICQIVLMTPLMLRQKKGVGHLLNLSAKAWWCLFWRSLMHILGIVGMYYGLKHMALADTTAIAFIYPILMLFAGHIFMQEQIGPHRIAAALFGFIGTLMVVQPNFLAVGANALWPVGVAGTFVVFMLVTRTMSREIDPISIQVVSGIMALGILFIPVLVLDAEVFPLFSPLWPSAEDWPLLIGAGTIGTVGHLLMTAAVRYTPSATLAPMQYLEIPFATAIGWAIFSDLPNQLAGLGIVVTVCGGIYMIYREQLAQRQAASHGKA